MKLQYNSPPHIRSKESNFTVMGDVLIVLVPLYMMAFYYYGSRALILGLVSLLNCLLIDVVCTLMAGKKVGLLDLSPIVTGLLIPLMLPASIPYYIVLIAGLFAIAVVKHPFGGLGQNIFNPAAAGIAFAALTWPTEVFSYPIPTEFIPDSVFRLGASPAAALKLGATPNFSFADMILGNFTGPMGATHILVLMTCLIFLVTRKSVSWKTSLAFLSSVAAVAFLFPRVNAGRMASVGYELMSGAVVFAAVFLINDPTTGPKRESSKVVYAILCGAVTMLFRYAGGFEEGVFFAVLLLNAFAWPIDMKNEEIQRTRRRARYAEQTSTAQ